jgi:hypothetical protein
MPVFNKQPGRRNSWRVTHMIPVAGTLAKHPSHNHTDDKESDRFFTRLNMTVRTRNRDDGPHDVFVLSLHGGVWANKTQTASISFVCDHKAQEPTTPVFAWQWGSWHSFRWTSRHACSKSLKPDSGSGGDGGDQRNPNVPPKEDAGGPEQPIYDPEPEPDQLSGWKRTWSYGGIIFAGYVPVNDML